jgi:phosphatidylglycerophosphatase A
VKGRFIGYLLRHAATLCVVGYLPLAPGTFASLLAMMLVFVFQPSKGVLVGAAALLTLLGLPASREAEARLGSDARHIVIDEFSGFLWCAAFIPLTVGHLTGAFVLFRALDILKPPPLRQIERLPRGLGVMADDLAAAAVTLGFIHLWKILF